MAHVALSSPLKHMHNKDLLVNMQHRLYVCLACSNLSNNKLKDIREGAFDGASGVLELLLTGNKLTGLQGRMFRGLSGLKTLYVCLFFLYKSCNTEKKEQNNVFKRRVVYLLNEPLLLL